MTSTPAVVAPMQAAQAPHNMHLAHTGAPQPPHFYGKRTEDVEIWLYHFEAYKTIRNWTDGYTLVTLSLYLHDDAIAWWRSAQAGISTFEGFKQGMLTRFGESENRMMQRLLHIKQGKNESVRQYVDNLRLLANKTHYPELARKDLFVRGLNSTYQDKVKLTRPRTLQDAVNAAIDFEDQDTEFVEPLRQSEKPESELARATKEITQELSKLALQFQKQPAAPVHNALECWNCGRQGHIAKECRQPRQYWPQRHADYAYVQPQGRQGIIMRMQQSGRRPAFNAADYTPLTPEAQAYAASMNLKHKAAAPRVAQEYPSRQSHTGPAGADLPFRRQSSKDVLHNDMRTARDDKDDVSQFCSQPSRVDFQALQEVVPNLTSELLATSSAIELLPVRDDYASRTPETQAYAAACEARKQCSIEDCIASAVFMAPQEPSARQEAGQQVTKTTSRAYETDEDGPDWPETAVSTTQQRADCGQLTSSIDLFAAVDPTQLPVGVEEYASLPEQCLHDTSEIVKATAGAGSCYDTTELTFEASTDILELPTGAQAPAAPSDASSAVDPPETDAIQADRSLLHEEDQSMELEAAMKRDEPQHFVDNDTFAGESEEPVDLIEESAGAQESTALHSAPQTGPALPISLPTVESEAADRPADSSSTDKEALHQSKSAELPERVSPVSDKPLPVRQTSEVTKTSRLQDLQNASKQPLELVRGLHGPSPAEPFEPFKYYAPFEYPGKLGSAVQDVRSELYTTVMGGQAVQPNAACVVRMARAFLLFLDWIILQSVARICWDPGILSSNYTQEARAMY